MAGLAYGATGRTPVNWNSVGGGYNRLYSNESEGLQTQTLPIFAYLAPEDHDLVFAVCP